MVVQKFKHRTDVDKSGRKRGSPGFDPSTAGGKITQETSGGGGRLRPGAGNAARRAKEAAAKSKFQQLAKSRGVDLPAEQARAQSQLESGQRVGGITASTLARQSQLISQSRTWEQIAADPFRQSIETSSYTSSRATPQERTVLQKIKDRILLDFAAVGIGQPPQGIRRN